MRPQERVRMELPDQGDRPHPGLSGWGNRRYSPRCHEKGRPSILAADLPRHRAPSGQAGLCWTGSLGWRRRVPETRTGGVVRRNHPPPPLLGGNIMMDNRKKRHGRFGSVQCLASTAAIAILAVSPAIVPMTGSHRDGVGVTITEAVFGHPVSAQVPYCVKSCLATAEVEYQDCLDRNPWYLHAACWLSRKLDRLSCAVKILTC